MRTTICPGVTWVGVKDPELEIFDIVVPTEFGTTYNSYLIQGEKATALIDTSKLNFSAEYFANVETLTPLDKIDYVVVQHTEPDHAGCLLELIRRHPNITVIHSKPCTKFIENLVNCPFNSKPINNGDEIDLGGKTLRFYVTPFLHWPDTMVSYLVEDQVLFSCDIMGSHFTSRSNDAIFNSELDPEDFGSSVASFKYYYSMIMRPYKEHIIKAFKLLDPLQKKVIATSHGPILDRDPSYYYDWYALQATNYLKRISSQKVTIIYASSYGNTVKMMEAVCAGLEDAGVELVAYDAATAPMEAMIDSIELSAGVIFGTSTINSKAPEPILSVIANLVVLNVVGRKAAVFGSYGWSGEGITMTEGICDVMHMKVVQEAFKVQMTPSAAQLDEGRQWGYQFGLKVIE
ncbi:FprA family A-type flavoprotein [Chrysiogenes arsenatis]|uniref:FprA family A-type flavoprotein n=1 Tax=Chrysiogenes arsenatis TaxID=309797 RepID=UPI0004045968|nr:FprA family A-type flavoprotein [Chrysiogenes arsenatis]